MGKPYTITAIGISLALVCVSRSGAQTADATQNQICLRHSPSVVMDNYTADAIIARDNAILESALGSKTSRCAIRQITRKGSVGSLATGFPITVSSQADFDKLTSNKCVNVVELITWCGPALSLNGSVLGCAPVGGAGAIVERRDSSQTVGEAKAVEPITWLHELGHNLGLTHNIDTTDVMSAGINSQSIRLLPSECDVFSGKTKLAQAGAFIAGATALPAGGGTSTPPPTPEPDSLSGNPAPQQSTKARMPVEEFVKQSFPGGFPHEEAQTYSSDLHRAEQLLADTTYAPYRNNIIALLGVIGDRNTIALLRPFVTEPFIGKPTLADINARLSAPLAIGLIAARLKLPADDVEFLSHAADQNFWLNQLKPATVEANKSSAPDLPVNGKPDPGKAFTTGQLQAYSQTLAVQSLRGYAITGSDGAHEKLALELGEQQLTDAAATTEQSVKTHMSILNDAIKLNENVAKNGAFSVLK